jgi:hypothetical protein
MEGAHSLIDRVFRRTRGAGFDHLGEKAGLFVIQRNSHSCDPFLFYSIGYRAGCHGVQVRPLCLPARSGAVPVPKAGIAAPVVFDSEASGTATLIEIVAEDRPGLLYDLATAISANDGNIEVVLIDTQAHKAIDVFFVTAGGAKLSAEQQAAIRVAVETAAGVAGSR